MTSTPCRLCAKLPGCPILEKDGEFMRDRVIDENTAPGVCEDFTRMGDHESATREMMYTMLGEGYLRALHCLPRDSLSDIKEDEDMEVPDFAGMILEGMTPEARLDQLLYLTDDEGNFIEESGNKVPRGELPVRKYAADPEGPIGPPECETIAYWDFEKVLDAIMRAEKKHGWIAGSKKAKKTNQKTAAPKPAKKKEEEKNMATAAKPRILLRRPGAPGGAKPPAKNGEDKTPAKVAGKVSKPATGKKRGPGKRKPAVVAASDNGASETPEAAASVDLSGVEGSIEALEKGQAELSQKLDIIIEAIGTGPGERSVSATVVEGLTVLHDALQQKISNLYYGLAVDEAGNAIEGPFPFLPVDDGRDCAQNLFEGEEPVDLFVAYLDGAAEGEGEEAAEG